MRPHLRPRRRHVHDREVERVTLLASVVGAGPEESADLTRRVLPIASGKADRLEDGLLETFGGLAAQTSEPDEARGRLLLLAVDVEQRPLDDVARLLALPPESARALLDQERRRAGLAQLGAGCRGWALASRRGWLTEPEQQAAAAHVQLCRRCRDGVAALARARRDLLARTGGVAALLGAGQVAALGGGSAAAVAGGTGAALAGKAGLGAIAALGAAVAIGGAAAAVLQNAEPEPGRAPVPAPVVAPADVPASSSPTDATPSPGSSPTCASPCVSPSPTSLRSDAPLLDDDSAPLPAPLPEAELEVEVPALPLPSVPSLPPAPTVELSPVPLPSPDVSLLDEQLLGS